MRNKHITQWAAGNVFEYFQFINNHKYKSFAIQLKNRQVDGAKLLKYDRKKIRTNYINYTDSLLRKEIFDEIQILKRLNQSSTAPTTTATKSVKANDAKVKKLIKKRKRSKKLGPRDIGKNTHYKAISYSLTQLEFGNFLNERVHPTSNYQNFQKRKQLNPLSKHQTVEEIGINHDFQSPGYQIALENGDFLSDRIHPYANDEEFQRRKLLSPVSSNETLEQIGDNKHYKGISYSLTKNETEGTFLDDSVHPLSSEDSFQKRKMKNPLDPKETVEQIGDNLHYDGIKHSIQISPGFLNEAVHPLSSAQRFEQRKLENPILSNETVEEIGDNQHYKEISYQLRHSDLKGGDFLKDRINAHAKEHAFKQRKMENPVNKKETVQQIGHNESYQGAEWKLEDVTDDEVFLDESGYYKARTKMITDVDGVVEPKLGPVDIGKVEHYVSVSYDLSESERLGSFLNERAWYDSSKISDKSLSWLLKNLPAHKLRIMDQQILPTGAKTKVLWLKKLRDLVVDGMQYMFAMFPPPNVYKCGLCEYRVTKEKGDKEYCVLCRVESAIE